MINPRTGRPHFRNFNQPVRRKPLSFEQSYLLFVLICHGATCVSILAFMLSQTITSGFIWASFIASPLVVMWQLATRFLGWASSIVFFIIFVLLTFSMTTYNVRNNAVHDWIVANPSYGNYHYQRNTLVRGDNIAGYFKDEMRNQWYMSSDERFFSNQENLDTHKAFDAAWEEFTDWIIAGANGTPPVPTPKFMGKYMLENKSRFRN